MRKSIPLDLRCNWQRAEVVGNSVRLLQKGSKKQTGTWMCIDCKQWTANLPIYKSSRVCEKKDRRKGKVDRRQEWIK